MSEAIIIKESYISLILKTYLYLITKPTENLIQKKENGTLELNSDDIKATKSEKLSILHLNIQGIQGKCETLRILAEQHKVDIQCRDKHWLSKDDIKAEEIDNF